MDIREKTSSKKRLIDANGLKKKMCFKCNDEYSDEPCDPSDCVFCNAINNAPTVDAVEAIKSTEEIEQALSILNIYRNSYYAEPSNTVKYAVANAINTILPLFVKCLERRSE